ncbi:Rv3235 family protein [Pseudonocardia sp.]|uniref:Rv3235 family protein n=1 Tax=Pseudonocardia sp. TaxID=60912 RepID=UPI00260D9BA0|nr:Rv3235 family protein [Pseudonocardia sp.]
MTSLPTTVPARTAPRTVPHAPPTLRRVAGEPDAAVDLPPPRPRAPAPEPPAPRRPRPGAREAATVVLRIACEVLDGRRPATHLATHVDGSVLRYWRATVAQRGTGSDRRRRSPARFARMRVCHPHPEAAEVAVAVEVDGGVRALAARFDHCDGRWRCTAMRLC